MKFPPLYHVQLQGMGVDISETTILQFLHGQEFTESPPIELYEHRHFLVTSKEKIEDPTERTDILKWIPQMIAIEEGEAPWVTNPR